MYRFLCLSTLLLLACKKPKPENASSKTLDEAYKPYVLAYTYGVLDRDVPIKLRFTRPVVLPDQVGKESDLRFEIEPETKGKTRWADEQTLEFIPDEYWPCGETIKASFDISEVIDTIPNSIKNFNFSFQTKPQEISLECKELNPLFQSSMQWYSISGEVFSHQKELAEKIETCVQLEGYSRKIQWHHHEDQRTHSFLLDSIERKKDAYEIRIKFNGNSIQLDKQYESTIKIPSLGDFKVLDISYHTDPEPHLEIEFSDPLLNQQHWATYIHSKDLNYRFIHEGNRIKAYPEGSFPENVTIKIEQGLLNSMKFKLQNNLEKSFSIEKILPQIRQGENNAVIVPYNDHIPFSFQAVGIKAVDIQITKIYENNVLQFLQHNDLDGDWYLHYVGNVLLEKKISLEQKGKNLNQWNWHMLDLGSLIKSEPGAVYRIQVRFRKEYVLWECEEEPQKEPAYDVLLDKPGLWDYYEGYDYEYLEHPTPCDAYYYRRADYITQNILASDLGITSKYNSAGNVFTAVADIKSAQPSESVKLLYYNFQKKLLGTSITDSKGMSTVELPEKPYFLMAQKGMLRGFLKYNSDELSYSRFETSGANAFKGVKGYLYAERGVWRPGDSLFINFILDDSRRLLPPNYPLVFELFDPNGNVTQKIIQKKNLNGFYSFPCATDLSAPTGFWTGKVNVGGIHFEKSFHIETIVPNKLKIHVTFEDSILEPSSKSIGTLNANWLNGAPASGLKTKTDYSIAVLHQPFGSRYEGFHFSDPLYDSKTISQTILEGKLGESSSIVLPNKIKESSYAPGMLRLDVFTKVFESGGNFSSDYFSTRYSPFTSYLGIKTPDTDNEYGVILTSQEYNLEIAHLDKFGKPAPEAEIEVELYQLNHRYWWEQYDNLESYNGRYYKTPIRKETLKSKNGKLFWKVKIEDKDYGNYLIRASLPDGHSCGKTLYFDTPNWYSRTRENNQGITNLVVRTDKANYQTGDVLTLEIPDSITSNYLITIEKGDKLISSDWLWAEGKSKRTYSIPVTAEMAPNFYVYVSAFQPYYSQAANVPLRRYAVIPVRVDDHNTHLQPVITASAEWKPESTASVKISEKNNKAMTYTLAIVDEGLLDLTHYKTPDPHPYFYSKEALLINTSDIYGNIVTGLSKQSKKALSIGGDGSLDANSRIQRFKPMVKFMGPYFLAEGQTHQKTLRLPNYNGAVRIMVIAGHMNAYGKSEISKTINNPLTVLTTLPRVLGPKEKIQVPVTVFVDQPGKPVTLRISGDPRITFSDKTEITFTPTRKSDYQFYFPATIGAELSSLEVKCEARQDKLYAHEETKVDIRLPNQRVTKSVSALLKNGESKEFKWENFGIQGSNTVSVEISSIPEMKLEKRLEYLIQYPHGCVEQTTSSVFPQLCLNELMELTQKDKKEIEQNINEGIKRLYLFQQSSGELSYWPGNTESSTWGTLYAGHFMLKASQKGYYVSPKFINAWKQALSNLASTWSVEDGVETHAYCLYLLAQSGNPDISAMNRLKELLQKNSSANWMLAGAYAFAGQRNTAISMLNTMQTNTAPYRQFSGNFGSDIRDKAIALEILAQLKLEERAYPVMESICKTLASDNWLSTQETAYCLIAVSAYAKNKNLTENSFEIKTGNDSAKKITFKSSVYRLKIAPASLPIIQLKNTSSIPLYASLLYSGIPEQGTESTFQSGIALNVRYLNQDGKEIQINQLKQGTYFFAEITVQNLSQIPDIENVALSFGVPSGWQIQNPRMSEQNQFSSSPADYMDIRDDVVHYYFDLTKSKRVFYVALNASFLGTTYLPATKIEAMYDVKFSALQKGKWINVIQ